MKAARNKQLRSQVWGTMIRDRPYVKTRDYIKRLALRPEIGYMNILHLKGFGSIIKLPDSS